MAKKKSAKQKDFDTTAILGGFDLNKSNLFARQNKTLLTLIKKNGNGAFSSFYDTKLADFEGGNEVATGSRDALVGIVEAAILQLDRIDEIVRAFRALDPGNYNAHHTPGWKKIWEPRSILMVAVRDILRKKLPFNPGHIKLMADWVAAADQISVYWYPLSGIVKAIENVNSQTPLERAVRVSVEKMLANIRREWDQRDFRKFTERLENVLGSAPEIPLKKGEAWSDAALADLQKLGQSKAAAWTELIVHCQGASQGKPSKKWLDMARALVEAVNGEDFKRRLLDWFPLVDKPRTDVVESWSEWSPNPNLMIIDLHADILKGLVWCCSLFEDPELARTLTALAISAYKKVPGVGPRAVKVGNACVYALGTMPGMDGVAQLAILKVRVKFGTAQKGIEKALVATAERVGIPREELEEMSVPAYGLTEVGMRTETLGDFKAELRVAGRKSELHWFKPDGKEQKTVPKAVKEDFGDELKELKQAAKDIEKMLPAQAARIEQTYLQQKEWSFPIWSERYLDHPLVGTLARRLIWRLKRGRNQATVIWSGKGLVDQRGKSITWADEKTTVKLWHPLDEKDTARITAWRDWLVENEVRQPFKQAHREIYILTDAERNTGVYSNRFAAHVLKQHQFNALCLARGWKNKLRLLVDDEYPPAHLVLPSWNLRAEFWIEGAGDDYGTDTNEAGTFYYLTTDQVRFYSDGAAINYAHAGGGGYGSAGTDRDENHALNLEGIPPLVFSEVMRDVDLFVGVASVGNDPNWADGGPEGRYRDYWQSYSFGELSSTAGTRKSVLEGLIPRLKIADRCSFSDRFLIVRGDIRTYKIHLGSGNIMMEPTDEYLCIVPKQSAATKSDGIFLPFEGDGTMSIILSKAFLLADDTKIKDPTIVTQIKR